MRSLLVQKMCGLAIVAVVLNGVASEAQGQDDVTVRIIEEPYRPVHAFLLLHFEGLGRRDVSRGPVTVQAPQVGFGLGLMSARRTNLQFRTNLAWRQLTVTDFGDPDRLTMFDVQLGGRFYPLEPTSGFVFAKHLVEIEPEQVTAEALRMLA